MLPTRVTTRLPGYDYSQPCVYFVTVCTFNRQMLLGSVRQGQFFPSSLGFLVQDCWHHIAKHYGNVSLRVFQGMPNHLHATVHIKPTQSADRLSPAAAGLSSIIGSYKSAVSREAGRLNLAPGRIWSPRFYDHVVRHEGALHRIEEYIVNNPMQWTLDRENPDRCGMNEFYVWLEKYSRAADGVVKNSESS
jgi:putative transposase